MIIDRKTFTFGFLVSPISDIILYIKCQTSARQFISILFLESRIFNPLYKNSKYHLDSIEMSPSLIKLNK